VGNLTRGSVMDEEGDEAMTTSEKAPGSYASVNGLERRRSIMNITLWIVQVLLALFVAYGRWKVAPHRGRPQNVEGVRS
jgi:hypothetical protein